MRPMNSSFLLALVVISAVGIPAARALPVDLYRQCNKDSPGGVSDERAISACTAIILSPETRSEDRAQFLAVRASLFGNVGKGDRALADINKAVEMAPNDGTLYSERCAIKGQLGVDLDAALADCEKSLVLKPGESFALESRGIIKFRRGDFAGSVTDMNAVLAMSPRHSDALYIRGLAKRKSGDPAGGDADVAAAKAIYPKIAETYAGYGVTP